MPSAAAVVAGSASVGVVVLLTWVEKLGSVVDDKVVQTSTGTPSCRTISQFGLAVINVKVSASTGSNVVIKSDVIGEELGDAMGSKVVGMAVVVVSVVVVWAAEVFGGRVSGVVLLVSGTIVVVDWAVGLGRVEDVVSGRAVIFGWAL